ncbi:hypothetical protein PICMEDRAFT_55424 [Pichia membranifaciens NRRL Y-2026]|uniref:F-box domain-containing protein n=1 Tax=Pichia membranifaciens NRRL Y-2026 TaxID=763406 RepID=A0A1E3NER2_9ASCO|nr:hypothetical protein PICMEDRAFT_55424 [Pichia membranifaciens NRRL Y-2026]ODQ44612.1 hypothetical protein PICMEDRAFT_55424 [Pichia membranifaciens NRRL Y-2026]
MDFAHPNKKRHIENSLIHSSNAIELSASSQSNLNLTSYLEDHRTSLPLPSPSASPIHSSAENLGGPSDDTNGPSETALLTQSYPTSQADKFSLLTSLVSNLNNASPEVNALLFQLLQKTDKKALSFLHSTLFKVLKKDLITTLPTEIISNILQNLDHTNLLNCFQVSKKWSNVISHFPELWKNLIFKEKLITTEDDYLEDYELIKNNRPDLSVDKIPQLIYQRRLLIQKRWMNTNYKPKRLIIPEESLDIVTCLQFDKDKIAVGSDANHIIICDTESGKLLKTLRGHNGGVWAMKFYKNTLASGATDRSVRIWDIERGVCTHIFRGHTATVRCLEIIEPRQIGTDDEGNPIIYPEAPLLITGARDNALYVWKLPINDGKNDKVSDVPIDLHASNNPNFVTVLRGHTAAVRAVTGYANIVISGSYDSTARVWDLRTGECKWILKGHTGNIYSCVYDVKRNRCYTGCDDNTLRVWDLNTGETIAILEGHQSLVGLITSSDNVLVSAAADSTVRLWDPDTGQTKKVFRGHRSPITCVASDDYKVLSGSQGMLKLWDVQTGAFVRDLANDVDGAVWQVAFDYRRCVAAMQRDNTTFIDVTDFCPAEDDPWAHPSSLATTN